MNKLLICLLFFIAQTLSAQWAPVPMPAGGDIQFMGTAHNRVWVRCSGQNFFSDDEGLSWQHWTLPGGTEAGSFWISDNDLLTEVHFPANTPEGYEEAILRSTDNGNTWDTIFYDELHQFHIGTLFSAGGICFL